MCSASSVCFPACRAAPVPPFPARPPGDARTQSRCQSPWRSSRLLGARDIVVDACGTLCLDRDGVGLDACRRRQRDSGHCRAILILLFLPVADAKVVRRRPHRSRIGKPNRRNNVEAGALCQARGADGLHACHEKQSHGPIRIDALCLHEVRRQVARRRVDAVVGRRSAVVRHGRGEERKWQGPVTTAGC